MAVALHQARNIAQDFISLISPFVVKSLIVGDVRRQLNNPRNINIITHPIIEVYPQKNLFDEDTTALVKNFLTDSKILDDIPDWFSTIKGPIHFKWEHPWEHDLKLNLWLVPPEQWGIASVNRTGDESFVKRLNHWALSNRMHITGQRLHDHPREGTRPETRKGCILGDDCTRIIPTPTEVSLLSALHLPLIEPTIRTVQTINKFIGEN